LQEFWPLQLLLADLQDDWPLQELTPSHFTLPSSAAAAVNEAVANMIAAAAARAMLPVFRVFINASPVSYVAENPVTRPDAEAKPFAPGAGVDPLPVRA
jgi:hypothetical protein